MDRTRNNPSWCCDQIEEKIKDYKLSLTETTNEEIIKSSQDIHCDKCGKYLFTEKDVIKPGMSSSVTERENDTKNYKYMEMEDVFVCDKCSEN